MDEPKARKVKDKADEKTKTAKSAEKAAKKSADKTKDKLADKAKDKAPPAPAKTVVAKAEPAAPDGQEARHRQHADRQRRSEGGEREGAGYRRQADASGSTPEFRWPARGRIIEGFKSGGNDGINISVPPGTSVRAAESGVVVYSGDGLKGYGNLVLIKHPNGFVSAYANNGELDVKRGETVKRGQIIAKSGDTGNVNAPQLHFELRKGSTPVDPTQYLAGL